MSIEIPLTRGKIAVIDDEDFDLVSGYKWYANNSSGNKFYAMADTPRKDGKRGQRLYMHRLILGLTDKCAHTDHIDRDGLNNRRSNLRICTNSENQRNRGILVNNTSGYKGVSRWTGRGKGEWQAQIMVDGKGRHLGLFTSKEDAYAAYCKAAKELHGEFANYG